MGLLLDKRPDNIEMAAKVYKIKLLDFLNNESSKKSYHSLVDVLASIKTLNINSTININLIKQAMYLRLQLYHTNIKNFSKKYSFDRSTLSIFLNTDYLYTTETFIKLALALKLDPTYLLLKCDEEELKNYINESNKQLLYYKILLLNKKNIKSINFYKPYSEDSIKEYNTLTDDTVMYYTKRYY